MNESVIPKEVVEAFKVPISEYNPTLLLNTLAGVDSPDRPHGPESGDLPEAS